MIQPDISFVVPLFNHLASTQAMLVSLQATLPAGLAHEIILVDDASTDGTRQWLASLTVPNLRMLLNAGNQGFARTANAGVAQASGQVLALLNNDLLLSPGWLEPMLAALNNPSLKAGVVGNVQTRVADGSLDHAGVQMAANGKLDHVQVWPPSGLQQARVFAVTGACCLIRREVFNAVGGFDDTYINGCEDIDLCQKVKAKGLHVVMAYGSVVQHHVSLSRGRTSQQNEENSRHLYARWRKEFKAELANVWLARLQAGAQTTQGDAPDGQFTAAMLATPHVLARLMAESVLQKEEVCWARMLDGEEPNANLPARCQVQGLRFDAAKGGQILDSVAELHVSGLRSVRNFYVCGQILAGYGAQPVALTLSANGMVQKTFTLQPGEAVNVGIIAPVCLPGVTNCFAVQTSAPLRVSHFVLDDQVIEQLN